MRHNSLYYALLCLLWQLSCGDLHSPQVAPLPAVIIATQEQVDTLQVVANRYIVLFKSLPGMEQVSFVGYRDETIYFSPFLNEKYHYDMGITDIRLISSVTLPSLRDETLIAFNNLNWQESDAAPTGVITEVRFTSNKIAASYLQRWQERGDIYFAEPVYVSLVGEEVVENDDEENKPTPLEGYAKLAHAYDEYQQDNSGDHWWHEEIKLADAMELIASSVRGGSPDYETWDTKDAPIVAVFDSGIDYEHPALQGRMISTDKLATDRGCGANINGCNTTNPEKGRLGNGDAHPWGTQGAGEFCPTKTGEYAACPHGTHVAGIIAADGDVGRSGSCKIAGVCPFCKILNIRVLAGVGEGGPEGSKVGGVTDSSILNGLKYVHELWHHAGITVRVINASIGKFHRSRAVALLISNLKKLHKEDGDTGMGVLVVGAAGNEDAMARTYPAALDEVLAVSATGANGKKSEFSNFGMWVDIAAPGGSTYHKICSTFPGNKYQREAGTSMATPVVAGVAGLIAAVQKNKPSATDIENILLFSADTDKLYPQEGTPSGNENSDYYYPHIEHVEYRVPLLGVGLLNAHWALGGNKDDQAQARTDNLIENKGETVKGGEGARVTFCGTIAMPMAASPILLMLLLPLLLVLGYQCRSSCT